MSCEKPMTVAMRELRSDMTIEKLFYAAVELCGKRVLNGTSEGGHVTYYVGDVLEGRVLDMEAMPDGHTGKGFTPPWGTLHVYDAEGRYKEAVKIPEARTKIWG